MARSQPQRSRRTRTATSAGLGVAVLAATTALAPGTAQAADVAPVPANRALALAVGTSPTAAVPVSTPEVTHVVRPDETVSHLALRYGTSAGAIVAANGLDSRALIRIGQTLTIPAPGAAAPAAQPAPAPAASQRHVVAPNETVSDLALRYGTSIGAIVAANGLDSRALIRIGQTLTIPAPGAPTPAPAPQPAPAPAAPAPATGQRHVVAPNETVSDLALRYGTSIGAIVAANGLDSRALIRIGQTLTIPAPRAPTPAPAPQLVGNTFAGRTYANDVVAAANANKATLLGRAVPSRDEMQALIRSTAAAMGVDPALAQAISYQESGFDQRAVSPANAIGAMQVIPSSGVWASDLVGRQLDLLDPRDNVTAGVAILRQLLRSTGDQATAIAGYYQGLGSVRRNGMYTDTRRYVANVQALMTRFA